MQNVQLVWELIAQLMAKRLLSLMVKKWLLPVIHLEYLDISHLVLHHVKVEHQVTESDTINGEKSTKKNATIPMIHVQHGATGVNGVNATMEQLLEHVNVSTTLLDLSLSQMNAKAMPSKTVLVRILLNTNTSIVYIAQYLNQFLYNRI